MILVYNFDAKLKFISIWNFDIF